MSNVNYQIDQICIEYEDRLQNSEAASITDRIGQVASDQQSELLRRLLRLLVDNRGIGDAKDIVSSELSKLSPELEELASMTLASYSPVSLRPPRKGERLGRYLVGKSLGEGKLGCVLEAWDEELERTVALKAPALTETATNSTVDRFCHEMKSLAGLQHPCVLVIHDILRDDYGWPWMVLDYCGAGSIELTVGEVDFNDFVAIAEGLDYIHQQGIIHRDLKPANILKHSDGRTVIADFGLSLHSEHQKTAEGETAGTLYYMSPEQVLGEAHWMDGRADIWAVGVMLYEALCGERPFDGDSRAEIVEQILSKPARPPRQVLSSGSASLEQICLRCLSKSPDDRYFTAGDLAVDLKRALNPLPKRKSQGNRVIGFAVVALLAMAVIYQTNAVTNKNAERRSSERSREPTLHPELASIPISGIVEPVSSSFESSLDTWVGSGQCTIEFCDDPFQGKRSVRVTNRQRDIDGLLVDITDQVVPERRYFVSGYVKSDVDDMEILLQLAVKFSDREKFVTLSTAQPHGSWIPIDGSFVLEEEPTSVMLSFRCLANRSDDVLVDAVDIVEVAPRDNQTLVQNPSFEDGLLPWALLTAETATFHLDSDAHHGASALRVADREGPASGPGQEIQVTKGQLLFCTAMVKSIQASAGLRINARERSGLPQFRRIGFVEAQSDAWSKIEGTHKATSDQVDIWVGSETNHVEEFLVDSINVIPLKIVRRFDLSPKTP